MLSLSRTGRPGGTRPAPAATSTAISALFRLRGWGTASPPAPHRLTQPVSGRRLSGALLSEVLSPGDSRDVHTFPAPGLGRGAKRCRKTPSGAC